MGAPGRGYVEKMIEGVTELDLSGGTLLYKKNNLNITTDATLTNAQSGMSITFKTSGITASLPQATAANEGVWYQFSNGVAASTANLFITASSGGQFFGTIGANTLGCTHAGLSPAQYGLKGVLAAIGDQVVVTSIGLGWIITSSNVSGSTWLFKAAGVI
tara:strand:+ start:268 stop:747 length:480 start_codon:yes stop_codon:yes gene_type:complete